MGFISGKVFAGIMAGTLTVSAVAYTGATFMDEIKMNVDKLQDRILLTADEAASKIGTANSTINQKNLEIDRLEGEVDRLNEQLGKANTAVTKGNEEVTKANGDIAKANEDMESVKSLTAKAVSELDKDVISERVVDHSDVQVVGEALVFTVVTNQDEPKDGENERTLRLSNPNGVPVNVTVTGTVKGQIYSGEIAGGDVMYFKKNNTGEMLKLSYTVPGTGEVKNVTK
ncbi:coiled-coil domain-containing protein [Metabacillus sp. 113a]|uniref:coiled-coil domain-containing protein n=1 Tax=Metabacillus sp. 113a TaxID=3404706 RepID=UPI003CE68480